MNAISISVVRDEEDVIETFVRHHAPRFERMVIVCHQCVDRTEEILTRLKEEGLPLDIRQSDATYHAQADIMTAFVSEMRASTDKPDWLFFLDADEFLIGDIGGLDTNMMALIPWRTYVPMLVDDASELNPLKRIRHRRTSDPELLSKLAIPRAILDGEPLRIMAGNHGAVLPNGEWPAHAIAKDMHVAHFPVRSAAQIARKAARGWEGVLANPNRSKNEAFHWRRMSERFSKDGLPDAATLTATAMRYSLKGDEPMPSTVLDPIECLFELRYTDADSLR